MLPQQETIILFVITSTIACLIPGPAVIYVVTETISKGIKTGLSAIWGLQVGFLLQVLAATCGLSVLILKSAIAFSILKFAGSIYLIYLGLTLLFRGSNHKNNMRPTVKQPSGTSFTHGVLVNLLNPKITVFFISYVPQFVKEGSFSPIGQIFFFGLIFCVLGTLTNIFYAFSANTAANRYGEIHQKIIFKKWLPGSIFLGFGLKLAFTDRQ